MTCTRDSPEECDRMIASKIREKVKAGYVEAPTPHGGTEALLPCGRGAGLVRWVPRRWTDAQHRAHLSGQTRHRRAGTSATRALPDASSSRLSPSSIANSSATKAWGRQKRALKGAPASSVPPGTESLTR